MNVPSIFPIPIPSSTKKILNEGGWGELHTRGKFAVRISESIFVQYHLDTNQESNFSHYFLFFFPLCTLADSESTKPETKSGPQNSIKT